MASPPPPPTTAGEASPDGPKMGLTRSESELGRRCFLCLGWESEDDPAEAPEWVNPCPCSLAAHQECALLWIDDSTREGKPLKCPVCKAEIKVGSPFDLALWLSGKFNSALSRTSPYLLVVIFTGSTLAGSASYGLGSLALFAGPRDAMRILWDSNSVDRTWYRRIHWGPALHLPLVGPVLVLHRLLRLFGLYLTVPHWCVYTVFARLAPYNEIISWPPSPWWVMALAPTVNHAYFRLYREFFGDTEKRLDRELRAIQGRRADSQQGDRAQQAVADGQAENPGQGAARDGGAENDQAEAVAPAAAAGGQPEAEEGQAPAARPRQGGGMGLANAVIDLLRTQGWEAVDDPEDVADLDADHEEHRHRRRMIRRRHIQNEGGNVDVDIIVEARDEDAAEHQPPDQDDNGDDGQQAAGAQRRNNGAGTNDAPFLIDIVNSLVKTLLFPGIAFAAGELLRLVLPRSWCQRPAGGLRATGLLQEQWGRSLAGGCLYVVLRDLFRLYVKHRKVAVLPLRKVRNVERRQGGGDRDKTPPSPS